MTDAKPPKTVAEWVDPAGHVPSSVVKSLEWRGVPAIPVYARWLRVDPSSHEAFFQESGHHKNWDHYELSLVHGLIPMYQKFTDKVYGDANAMALRGHNVGPMAFHISTPPTNMLLPMHLLSSSCKWPVTARRRLHRGKSLCAFSAVFAPYIYCSDEKEKEDKKGEPEPEPSGVGAKAKPKPKATATAKKPGPVGITMIPTGGKTVYMRLSMMDIVLGAIDVRIDKAIDKALKWSGARLGLGKDASRHLTLLTKQSARKAVRQGVGRYMRDEMAKKAGRTMVKDFLTKYDVVAPFKLVSFSFTTEELKVWSHTTEEWGDEWRSRGVREPRMLTPLELLPESEVKERQEPAPLSANPNGSEGPSEQPTPDYWTDPSQLSEQPTPDYWTDPSQLEEAEESLGPYDPERTMLDEFLVGAPHAW